MIRVLVADDSPTARALLVSILTADPEIQVIGEARNGEEAVEMTQRLKPHLVTMDLRMPRLDGLAATKEIMITQPTPIVIITASLAVGEVETSLHALRCGALAVMPKPLGPEAPDFEEDAQSLRNNVKALSQVKVVRHYRRVQAPSPMPGPVPSTPRGRFRVVAIATSTGGPQALHAILSRLPGNFPLPILIVQHISPGFIGGMADWLNKNGNLQVRVARDGESPAPHTVYLGPDGYQLGMSALGNIALVNAPPIGGFRPAGTYLFESVGKHFGAATLAVILTGMGEDGVQGLRTVRQKGGMILAQDEASSVIFGMPGAAIAAGLADQVLPVEAMAARLAELV